MFLIEQIAQAAEAKVMSVGGLQTKMVRCRLMATAVSIPAPY